MSLSNMIGAFGETFRLIAMLMRCALSSNRV